MANDDKKLYGFTSVKMKNRQRHQTVGWTRPDGSIVDVDFVDSDPSASTYKWGDEVCIGEVVRCVRPLRRLEPQPLFDPTVWATRRTMAVIDHFTREQFEDALPWHKDTGKALWIYLGVESGEHTYAVRVPTGRGLDLAVVIRSSIHEDGVSAQAGEDSIRCWLAELAIGSAGSQIGTLYAAKLQKYVTRVPGWQARMTDLIRTLYRVGMKLKPCPKCQKMMMAFKVQKGDNKGRLFQSCPKPTGKNRGRGWRDGCGSGFEWIELPDEKKKSQPVKTGELPPTYGIGRTGRREAWLEEGKGE